MSRRYCVYRLFDKHGELIYIGQTSDLTMRLRHHRSAFINPWARFVDHWTSEDQPDRPAALAAEAAAIEAERPPFNTHHNPDGQARRATYIEAYDAREPAPDPAVRDWLTELFAPAPP